MLACHLPVCPPGEAAGRRARGSGLVKGFGVQAWVLVHWHSSQGAHPAPQTPCYSAEHILLPRPRVIVHIQKQSYDVNDVDVEKGHHHHEVSPGADAALLDVHALSGERVSRWWWRGEMIHQLPLAPVQTLPILTHLLLNHCSPPCIALIYRLYLVCYLASVIITHYYAYMAIQMQILTIHS